MSPDQVDRLPTIRTRVRVADHKDAKVAVKEKGSTDPTEFSRSKNTTNGIGVVKKPDWRIDNTKPSKHWACLKVGGAERCVRWRVPGGDGVEHQLTVFDIKVDKKGKVYCLARYASLEAESECITCSDGTVVCGIEPYCK